MYGIIHHCPNSLNSSKILSMFLDVLHFTGKPYLKNGEEINISLGTVQREPEYRNKSARNIPYRAWFVFLLGGLGNARKESNIQYYHTYTTIDRGKINLHKMQQQKDKGKKNLSLTGF